MVRMTRSRSMPTSDARARSAGPDDGRPPEAVVAESGSTEPSVRDLLADVERLTLDLGTARAEIARLTALADEDPLCGILNRRGFERELRRSVSYIDRYGGTACLLIFDL